MASEKIELVRAAPAFGPGLKDGQFASGFWPGMALTARMARSIPFSENLKVSFCLSCTVCHAVVDLVLLIERRELGHNISYGSVGKDVLDEIVNFDQVPLVLFSVRECCLQESNQKRSSLGYLYSP